jgi:17 kDa outer membrane surface antigen
LSRIFQRHFVALFVTLALSACGTMGGGLKKVDSEPEIVTGSIPDEGVVNTGEVSDANTIRNAISAVDLSRSSSLPFSWANRETGSSGTISKVSELNNDGVVCRKFETSRESYDGVSLFHGAACIGADGQWFMQEFAQI